MYLSIDSDGYIPVTELTPFLQERTNNWIRTIVEEDPQSRFQAKLKNSETFVSIKTGYTYPLLSRCTKIDLPMLSDTDITLALALDLNSSRQLMGPGLRINSPFVYLYHGPANRWSQISPPVPENKTVLADMHLEPLLEEGYKLYKVADSDQYFFTLMRREHLRVLPTHVRALHYHKSIPLVRLHDGTKQPVKSLKINQTNPPNSNDHFVTLYDGSTCSVNASDLNAAALHLISDTSDKQVPPHQQSRYALRPR